jgi:uncharacterized membrane protein
MKKYTLYIILLVSWLVIMIALIIYAVSTENKAIQNYKSNKIASYGKTIRRPCS